jgi:hypothetical protein
VVKAKQSKSNNSIYCRGRCGKGKKETPDETKATSKKKSLALVRGKSMQQERPGSKREQFEKRDTTEQEHKTTQHSFAR